MSLDAAIQKALETSTIRCRFKPYDAKLIGIPDTIIDFTERVSACSKAMLSAFLNRGIILYNMDEQTCMKEMQDYVIKGNLPCGFLLPNLKIVLQAVGYTLTPEDQRMSIDQFNAKVLATYTYTQTFLPGEFEMQDLSAEVSQQLNPEPEPHPLQNTQLVQADSAAFTPLPVTHGPRNGG